MARNVYFAFHYQDVIDFRANVVRNKSKFKRQNGGFRDGSIWEKYPVTKVKEIKGIIDIGLKGNSVTCVLIGDETFSRRWVRYEIVNSLANNKGLFGVHINWIKGRDGKTKFWPGENPFKCLKIKIDNDGKYMHFFEKEEPGILYEWKPYKDLKKSKNVFNNPKYFGKSFKFSEIFQTYSYDFNNGNKNFDEWLERAAGQKQK
jgi:hypothetical protein